MAEQQRNQPESSETSSDTTPASGSVTNSVRSLPEMSRHSRQAGVIRVTNCFERQIMRNAIML